jgi:type II secretory pathway component PulF
MIRLSLREETRLVEAVTSLLESGVGLVDAYRGAEAALDGRSARAARMLRSRLECGVPLSDAGRLTLARLDPLHAAMLYVVDCTGSALSAFERARRFLRSRSRLSEQSTTAMLYPCFVTAAAIIAALLLVTSVLPAAADMLAPLSTPDRVSSARNDVDGVAVLISRGSRFLTASVAVLFGTAGGCVLLGLSRRATWRTPRLDRLRLRVPILGRAEVYIDLLSYSHALAAMLAAGTPLGDAMDAAPACAQNLTVRLALTRAGRGVGSGTSFAAAMESAVRRFRLPGRWFALAEHGAGIGGLLEGLIDFLEGRLETTAARIGALLEPAMVALAGAFVITTVLVLVKPLFELYAVAIP